MNVPLAPVELLEKLNLQVPLSVTDEALLQGPWCKPSLALEIYNREREARLSADQKPSVKELRKNVQNVFKEGKVTRVLAASLPPDSRLRQLESSLHEKVFHISSAESSPNRGGSRRFNVPLPIFRRVCDILHLREVVTPCLNDLTRFVQGRWQLIWVDLSTETAQWLTATFNVLTRTGFWQVTVTRDNEVISAFPIPATRLSSNTKHSGDNPQRCGTCRGCVTAGDEWSLLPSVHANAVHVRRPADSTLRMECSCGRLHSKRLKEQFECTCEPCPGELRLWANAIQQFELAMRNGSDLDHAIAQLQRYSTSNACGSCLQDRRCVAEAINAGCCGKTLRTILLPWLEKEVLEVLTLRVCEVRFSQHSISSTFTGEHKGDDIESLVRSFRLGLLLTTDKPIRVVRYHGEFWALDHRRLWAIQQYQLLEPADDVYVCVEVLPLQDIKKTTPTVAAISEFNKKYSTITDGMHMSIKHTLVEGSGTHAMNRTALASVVFGDLKPVRGMRESFQKAEFKLGDRTFSSVREVQEELELFRGDYVDGAPLPRDAFSLLLEVVKFHSSDTTRNEDVVCITVATSEAFRTPAFWLWKENGKGEDVSMRDCLEYLKYYLTNSPARNRSLVEVLSEQRYKGCLDQVGPRFGSIKLVEDVPLAGDTIIAGTSLFVVTHDLPKGSAVGSQLSFSIFRWCESSKNAGKLGALDLLACPVQD
mmetsp:Transcript_41506/g.65846  ORF Transcript_41506/g.65846 Transcript_41506/m.65846 type:complete len:707 (+) Transcript_41506:1-2121(+)